MNDLLGQLLAGIGHRQAQPHARPTQSWQNRVPVGTQLTQQDISRLPQQNQALAQIYNANPQDPRVSHMDPAQFGYAPDQQVAPPAGQIRYPRVNPQTGYSSMYPGEETLTLAGTPGGENLSIHNEPGINSIGGRIGNYGGTVGIDHGQVFANMNRSGQPTDPMAELRRFLGL